MLLSVCKKCGSFTESRIIPDNENLGFIIQYFCPNCDEDPVMYPESSERQELVEWSDVHYRRSPITTKNGKFVRWGYVYDPESGAWHRHALKHKWGWHRVTRVHQQHHKNYIHNLGSKED